jgi:orotidine-5'-phosphate decarboxylase
MTWDMSGIGRPNPIFVALDTPSIDKAVAIAEQVRQHVGGLKVGLEFISANGPDGVKRIVTLGLPVFCDVKFHDIPNTVAGAVREIARLGVAILNVHAPGSEAMMRAAMDAAGTVSPRPKVIGVTVLTSLDEHDLAATGVNATPMDQVTRLAKLAKSSGLDGVVCSPQEIAAVRAACGKDFLIVTPGVRPAGADVGDQRRVMTPAEAMKAGADILVIGRPITGASDPVKAAGDIASELARVRA